MQFPSPYQAFKRYRTLQTGRISTLPIVILMPHSACNCRCIMCDIWKGNKHSRQLTEADIGGLLSTLKKFNTREVVMSGGEALLNPALFRLCELLKRCDLRITLLSTGLTLKKHAADLLTWVNEIIVSLDGDETLHDRIRNIPGAYRKLQESVSHIRSLDPGYRITGRTVIHRHNFRHWPRIVESALRLGLNQISFLPADISSQAFNRETVWTEDRQEEVMISSAELPELAAVTSQLTSGYASLFENHFIAESPEKIRKIYTYYAALHGLAPFPFKRCNAPWVSTVIEADGSVKPCFFHPPVGNIHEQPLDEILNGEKGLRFRKNLDLDKDSVCIRCVCYLHLSPFQALSGK